MRRLFSMRPAYKFILWVLGIILVVFNLYAIISGKYFVYQVLRYTVFEGRMGPDINQFNKDPLAIIETAAPIDIPKHRLYNKKQLPEEVRSLSTKLGTTAFLVIKNDSILYESYDDGYAPDSLSNSFSMAKTIVGLLTGCALSDGAIKSLDDPIGIYLPWFDETAGKKVRVRDLLTMSSAINFKENYLNPFGFAAEILYGNNLKNTLKGHQLSGTPGESFDYQSGNTQLLCYLLEAAVKKPLNLYASEKLWIPIHATKNAFWSLDHPNGDPRAFCCFNSHARDFGKIGMLMLHGGKLYGKHIIDSSYMQEAVRPAKMNGGKNTNPSYGYHTWLLSFRGSKVFYARGILGQYIFCIPKKNLVIVRLGHKRSPIKLGDHPVDAYTYIRTAISLTEQN